MAYFCCDHETMDTPHERNVSKCPFGETRVRNERLWRVYGSQEESAFPSRDGLTTAMYHIAVRAKFTTVTLGSFEMAGMNCDLRRHGPSHQSDLLEHMAEKNKNLRRAAVAQYT